MLLIHLRPTSSPFLSLLAFILFSSQIVIGQGTGTWNPETPSNNSKPDQRHEAAYLRVGNKFYLLGGRGIKDVNIYDPAINQWTDGSSPPFEIHHFQPVVFQGKIYAVCAMTGGYPNETPIPDIMIYDPAMDVWSVGDSIPINRRRGSAGVVVHNDKFYIISGIQNGHQSGHVPWLDVYDPILHTWTTLPDAPRSRDHFQASVKNGKIYAVGGRTSIANQNVFANTIPEVDVYDINSQQWSTLSQNLPTERAGSFNAILGDEILVIGGESAGQSSAHDETEALDVTTNTWRTLSPMLQGRHGTGAVLYNDTLYTASGSGGRGGGPELTTQETFTFGIIMNPNQAPSLSPLPDQVNEALSSVNIQIVASDPDNDPISYQATGLPPGIQLDTTSGLISGTLPYSALNGSPWTVQLQVSDGSLSSASESFNWSIYRFDCNGDSAGTAFIDACGVCAGGKTGIAPESSCALDCKGIANGTAQIDTCGYCLDIQDPNFNNCACVGNMVHQFVLVNTDNGLDVMNPLMDGTIINLDTVSYGISIRAETKICEITVASVVFDLMGPAAVQRTENGAPWTLLGDNGGTYTAWNALPGRYTLSATPYSQSGGNGTAGTSRTIEFTLFDENTPTDCAGAPYGTAVYDSCGECLQIFNPGFNACLDSTGGNTSISNDLTVSDIQVYPNPLKDNLLNVKIAGAKGNSIEVKLVDFHGRQVMKGSYPNHPSLRIDLSQAKLTEAIYYLQIKPQKQEAVWVKVYRQ